MNHRKVAWIGLGLALFGALAVGCRSEDENPITPGKMQEIRRKEAEERGNFNQSPSAPTAPPSSG